MIFTHFLGFATRKKFFAQIFETECLLKDWEHFIHSEDWRKEIDVLLEMRLKLLCFIVRATFPVVFHVSNIFFYFSTLMFQNMTRACFLPGFAKLQNTPNTSIVIIIFGAKSIGGCVRGRSRVPVTPKPASSDHL